MAKRLLVDMDGTLARFHDEANYLERMFEKDFFSSLEPFQNMVEGIRQFIQQYPEIEVFIVSAKVVASVPYCEAEKNEWLDRYLPEIDREHRIFTDMGRSKAEYLPGGASKEDYLLDDYNKGLNLFLYDGGSAIKCHNNINQKGLGAYGGAVGRMWTGPMVHTDNKPEMIAAELAQHMGLEYDLNRVASAYAMDEDQMKQGASFHNPLNAIRYMNGDPAYAEICLMDLKNQTHVVAEHQLRTISMNVFGTPYHSDINSTVMAEHVREALVNADKPVVGQIILTDTIESEDQVRMFHSAAAMNWAISDANGSGRSFTVEWFIRTQSKEVHEINNYSELSEKLFYDHGFDKTSAGALAVAMLTKPDARTEDQRTLLLEAWNHHEFSCSIHQFLRLPTEHIRPAKPTGQHDFTSLDAMISDAKGKQACGINSSDTNSRER